MIFKAFRIRFAYTCSLHVPLMFTCPPHPPQPPQPPTPTLPRTHRLSDHYPTTDDHYRPLTTAISRLYEVIKSPCIGHITYVSKKSSLLYAMPESTSCCTKSWQKEAFRKYATRKSSKRCQPSTRRMTRAQLELGRVKTTWHHWNFVLVT